MPDHIADLAGLLESPPAEGWSDGFVRSFLRPQGLGTAATPLLADEIELAATLRRPGAGRSRTALLLVPVLAALRRPAANRGGKAGKAIMRYSHLGAEDRRREMKEEQLQLKRLLKRRRKAAVRTVKQERKAIESRIRKERKALRRSSARGLKHARRALRLTAYRGAHLLLPAMLRDRLAQLSPGWEADRRRAEAKLESTQLKERRTEVKAAKSDERVRRVAEPRRNPAEEARRAEKERKP